MNESFDKDWMKRLIDATQAATMEASERKIAFIYFGEDLEPKFLNYSQVEEIFKSPLILNPNNVSL